MARPDFYKILGVSPSASQDEIKLAHRELVKIFHPDLFSTSAEKARANKRLQQINEAYATLSNAGRRRQYDAALFKATPAANAASAAATKRSSASTQHPPSVAVAWTKLLHGLGQKLRQLKEDYATLAAAERRARREGKPFRQSSTVKHSSRQAGPWTRLHDLSDLWRSWAKHGKRRSSRKAMGVIAGAIILLVFALILSAVLEEPQTASAWGLLENTVTEPGHDSARERQWISLGHYNTTSECAESLRKQAALDAQRGGKVFLDERNSTIAMTIYAKSESALAEEYLRAKLAQRPTADRQLLEQEAKEEAREFVRRNGIAQRVKHYQCREVQLLKPQSWLRTKLKQLGLIN